MLAVGTGVVYPMHGGARIESVEERMDNGEKKKYYVLKMLCSDMVVSIPVDNAEVLGLRNVVRPVELKKVIVALKQKADINSIKTISWNRRAQIYTDRLKTGNIIEVAKIYKVLLTMDNEKRISVGERRLLHMAKTIIESELMLVKNMKFEEAEQWLDSNVR